jgi:hypothetical protein
LSLADFRLIKEILQFSVFRDSMYGESRLKTDDS